MSVGAVNKQTGDRIPTAGMPAIDSVLSGSSTNPVQNTVITAALADKQDKTDNNLTTTDKTTTGAINELKSGLTNLADVPVYTTDSALISAFSGKHDYYRTFVMSDSTKTMALLNAVNEEKVYVELVENQQMWSNHPNFYAFIQDSVWVGLLNIGENSISVPVCTKLAKNSDLVTLSGIFIHHDFSGTDMKDIITSLIAFIRDNTQSGHTFVLDGVFTDTTTTSTFNYNAVVSKKSSYVYGIVSCDDYIYNINYLSGTYKNIMKFTGTAL